MRYTIVSALQLIIFNSQLLAWDLRRPGATRAGRAGLIERVSRLQAVTEALSRTIDLIPHAPSLDPTGARQVDALRQRLPLLTGYTDLLDTHLQAAAFQPSRLAEYADGLHEEAMAFVVLVDAALLDFSPET